jgi:HAD superfamily hydrolase (TIGR01458 family)
VTVDGLLLDIDGVLAVSWEPLPGAIDAIASFRRDGLPFRLITNTTSFTCASLASTLREAGFDVRDEEVVTATVATAVYLRERHPDAAVFVLNDGDADRDLAGVRLVETPEEADVLVIGGAGDGFGYDLINRMFRRVMDGAALVGMHRNRFWRTAQGWSLDGGAYLAALEWAAGVEAVACGKPAAPFFLAAATELGVDPGAALMVGDDIENDVEGARAAGIRAALVRTGKYRAGDEGRGAPDAILESFADLPGWLRDQGGP